MNITINFGVTKGISGSKEVFTTHTLIQQQHWGSTLLIYDFQVQHVPLKKIGLGHADSLVRLISKKAETMEDKVTDLLLPENEIKSIKRDAIHELQVPAHGIKVKSMEDN